MLQNTWVAGGGGRGGRGGRGGAMRAERSHRDGRRHPASGENVEGRLVRIDDFLVTVGLADGTHAHFPPRRRRSQSGRPRPHEGHRDLLAVYTDKDMHDVTAYLVTLK